jgi:hypothetical protein
VKKLFAEAENFFKHADRDPDEILEFPLAEPEWFLWECVAKYPELGGVLFVRRQASTDPLTSDRYGSEPRQFGNRGRFLQSLCRFAAPGLAGAPSSHFYWLVLPLNDPYSPGGVDGDSASFSLLLPGNRPGVATELDTLLFWEQQVAGSNPVAR